MSVEVRSKIVQEELMGREQMAQLHALLSDVLGKTS